MSLDPSKLAELEAAFNAGTISAMDYAAAMGKAAQNLTTSSAGLGSSLIQAGKQIGTGVSGFTTAMANGQQGASVFNGVINSSSTALGTLLTQLGPLGTAFSKLTDFAGAYLVRANQQGDALFKSFQDLSRVGGAGAEGMTGVFNNMQQFGLSMNQLPEFGAMIAQNSEALAVMGGTVSRGTKAFANVASSIQQSGLQTEFERMGLTTKNINEGTANYLRIQTLTSAGAVKSQEALNAGAAEYIRQQDKLSRLTGKSADALAKEQEAQQANERYAAVTLELQMKADAARAAGDEAGAQAAEDQIKQNKELLARTPEALKQGVMDLMSGFVNSPEARKMYISLPEMSQSIISQNFKASQLIDKGAKEADANTKKNIGLAKAGLNDSTQASFAGQRALSRLKGEEAEKEATTQATTLAKGGDVDINNQVAMRQAQTATTIAMDNLVQKGVGPVTAGMAELAIGIEKVITIIPPEYIGEKTSTKARPGESASGRGQNAPAAAGYGTSVKPADLQKFLEESVAKAIKALNEVGKGPTTFTEKMDALKGKSATPTTEAPAASDKTAMQKLAELRTPESKSDTSQAVKSVASQTPESKSDTSQAVKSVASQTPESKSDTSQAVKSVASQTPEPKSDTSQAVKSVASQTPEPKSDTSQAVKSVAPQSAKPVVVKPVVNVEPVVPPPVVNIVPKSEPLAGPNTKYRTSLDDTKPEPPKTETTTQSTASASPELTQGLMTLAQNIGLQTSSMNELVDLMRRSLGVQGRILQQSRN